jgi:16S rRNA (cytidine1402-2'-O)-methyltransferase
VRSKDRARWFQEAARINHTFSFFEAPHRIELTFRDCGTYLVDRQICVCRELTKVHEESFVFLSQDLSGAAIQARGEFTLVVAPRPQSARREEPRSDREVFSRFLEASRDAPHRSRREVLLQVADELGLSRAAVYSAIERSKRD